jgi:hypothetical protein
MQQKSKPKLFTILFAMLCMQVVVASSYFTGIVEEVAKNKKYALSSLNKNSKSFSLYNLRQNFVFSGSSVMHQKVSNDKLITSTLMKFERGNTTYLIPYNYKVKISKNKNTHPTITIKL